VKRVDVAAGRRWVIYFPSLPRRGRTLNRRGFPARYTPRWTNPIPPPSFIREPPSEKRRKF